MKMKIFAAGIAAVTVGMLAPIPAMGVDKPSDSVSTSMTATPRDIIDDWHKPHPVPPLSGTMPTGTHPATAADMQKFVTKNWVSTVSTAKLDFTQSKLYKGNEAEFRTTFRKAEQKFNGNVPDTARTFGGGSTCRGSLVLVWFENDNVMRFIDAGPTIAVGCQKEVEEQDRELQTYLKQSTIYFNEVGDHMYLKRASDGAVSHWKLADAETVNRS